MSKNIIVINRGDTFKFNVYVDIPDTLSYKLANDDRLYFGIMDPNQMFEDALVKKKFTKDNVNKDNSITIEIKPEDTLNLYPGLYYYSIKLNKLDINNNINEVYTIINKTKFIIND